MILSQILIALNKPKSINHESLFSISAASIVRLGNARSDVLTVSQSAFVSGHRRHFRDRVWDGIKFALLSTSSAKTLTAIDANPGISAIAERRIRESEISVDHRVLNGESLPIGDRQFDSVVSTWTLCSIAKVEQALQEIHRVLKPGGRFFFIEHGLSRDAKTQMWQHRLTPIQKVIADGCHLDRDIRQLVERQFEQVAIDEFQPEDLPAVISYFYRGIAMK